MRVIDLLYNKYYPLTLLNRWISSRKNHKTELTIFCGNCIGGYIYHQLGLKFQTPTINITMSQPDLLKLVKDFHSYKDAEFEHEGGLVGRLKDIKVHFTHYYSFEDGVQAWKKRIARVSLENIYIIASDRDGITSQEILEYSRIDCKKLVIFTAKKYDLPYCFHVKEYDGAECVGNLLAKTLWGKWKFETFFDYVGWLNSDDVVVDHFRIKY